MADITLPLAVVTPIGLALGSGFAALWRRIAEVEKRERADCAERVDKIEERVDRIERQREDCEERWRREVERGARLHAKASLEAPRAEPVMPPEPEWEEPTGVKDTRRDIELRTVLEEYATKSEPPRPPQRSRPR